MKKNVLLLSIIAMALCGCTKNVDTSESSQSESKIDSSISEESSSSIESSSEEISSSGASEEDTWNIYDEDYSNLVDLSTLNDSKAKEHLPEDSSYETTDLTYDNVKYLETYVNNKIVDNDTKVTTTDDVKYIYYNDDSARLVSLSKGYAITLPTSTTVVGDFSLGKYRDKIYNEETTLTITRETSNPYGNTPSGWKTYRDEWLVKFFTDTYVENWMEENNLSLTKKRVFEDTTILNSYSIIEYCLQINDPGRISKMYYNIAVIRGKTTYNKFYLLVMKSNKNRNDDFEKIVKSFKRVDEYGEGNNDTYNNMEVKENPNWSENTKNYYEKLCTQQSTDWAFYTANLPSDGSSSSVKSFQTLQKQYTDAFDCSFQIVSSYSHISWSGGFTSGKFPKDSASSICGTGFDDKPVLQFNYQFTDNNNNLGSSNTSNNFSPMFDILRGDNGNDLDFDSYQNDAYLALVRLANTIKEYGNPVLFRLNNEMNSDWTSYCGLINMLDPDLFAASWRVLYKIFEEKGVDNCIWVFNPIATSCPYSSWGEDMCYFPGNDYVQVLGLTYYVMNNDNEATTQTFKSCYTTLYEKNNAVWNNYPWIISEFGCGSGGNATGTLYRNQSSQAKWVSDMFVELKNRPDYCKNIKGAVWFSVNDEADGKITNALKIVISSLNDTVAAFKKGFNL